MQFGPIGKTQEQLVDNDASRWDLFNMMGNMLKELKKVVLHLSFINDTTVKNTEVE
jgi:hypothetical protein